MEALLTIGSFVVLLGLGLTVGKLNEIRHFRRLAAREEGLAGLGVCNLRTVAVEPKVEGTHLVMGSAVIATDYFKVVAAGLRGLFGGEMRTYRTLMERARREALVRMLEDAAESGAQSVWNVRLETSTIQGKRRPGGIEVLAYGTAVKRL